MSKVPTLDDYLNSPMTDYEFINAIEKDGIVADRIFERALQNYNNQDDGYSQPDPVYYMQKERNALLESQVRRDTVIASVKDNAIGGSYLGYIAVALTAFFISWVAVAYGQVIIILIAAVLCVLFLRSISQSLIDNSVETFRKSYRLGFESGANNDYATEYEKAEKMLSEYKKSVHSKRY